MTQISPALAPLLAGYGRFRAGGWTRQRARWEELADGQSPRVMVIACSDSRVDPAQIFDVSPGEIFVVRNIANLVPPSGPATDHHGVSAAVEFAVTQLRVAEIVVLGHAACGGVRASLTRGFADAPPGRGGYIAGWIELLAVERDRVEAELGQGPDALRALEHAGVRLSLANLRGFGCVAERETAGDLALRGMFFSIADGTLHLLDESTGRFAAVDAAAG